MQDNQVNPRIKPLDIEEEMKKSFIAYAMAVIINRALPDVRDGLKPVHRRILYSMDEQGFTADKPFHKSARIVGDVLGKYHPHGDSSVYDAMVRLAQDFNTRYMLVEGQGNFGSIDGDSAAAMRYTEARLARISLELLADIDKDTVNFVSNYDWRDGIGPVEKRPRKRDLAWKSIETNEVGLDEFMKWADAAEVAPIYAVNLGTKGIEEALAVLEYCNMETGTYYSDLRVANGHEKPYGIKTWCLGNEMDGDWQIGHKTAEEYGRIAYETGKAMKILDPSIELVACGSSMSTNPTFGDWEQTVLEHCYPCLDYISLHQYYGGQEKGTAEFLAQSLDMERYIETVLNICDYVRVKKKMSHKINICFDEWGVWSMSDVQVQKSVEDAPWQTAPAIPNRC